MRFFPEPSLCAWNINEPLRLSWGELCSDSPPLLRVLLLLPVIHKDAERGEAQVCVMLSQSRVRADPETKMNAENWLN